MDLKIDREYIKNCFRDFVNTPSPVSYYDEILPVLERYAGEFDCPVTYDRKRTGYITLDGEDNSKTVMVGAHLDTLGAIVRKIEADGTIRVRPLGGVCFQSIEGETMTIHTRSGKKYTGLMVCQSHSTHVFDDARSLERNENTMMISLDERVSSREEVRALGIEHGDIVSFEPHCTFTENGYIKSRFIDDKAAVAAVFAALKFIKENNLKPKYRTLLSFPFYEEINHGGAYIPKEVEEFVAVDIGLIGPDYNGHERAVSICVKDNFSPYDRGLVQKLIDEAKANDIEHAIDIFYRYGTDANAAVRSGNNVYAAAFGMACYCSHGMERTHIDGIVETAKLVVAYLLELK